MMPQGMVTAAYIAASVLFILSLGGLSHPERARHGNLYGMLGMAIAIVATLASDVVGGYQVILVTMLVGGAIGAFVASRVEMTDMPQLVAMLHSWCWSASPATSIPRYNCTARNRPSTRWKSTSAY